MFLPYLIGFLVVACCSAGGVLALSWYLRREDPPPRRESGRVRVQSVLVREPNEARAPRDVRD
ncbi:hypothetical protein [Sandaracinus amylolyticus]|uniref:Uncharacterized protein n=1 Tax=Sandaracinus amylolyticus TaxID=927083 RepID=A0A0F6VYV8_9BACT|nr:hypothetical protein [Sandaracinus amylolyticus]AKF03136.1 hypothetical protein DB32_000285 [Sandaracinus amylolyticus]